MALWFVSYATSPFIVIVYDVSIPKAFGGKTDRTDLWVKYGQTKYGHLVDFGFLIDKRVFNLTTSIFFRLYLQTHF